MQALTHMYSVHTHTDTHIHKNVDKDSAILVVNKIFLYYFDGKGVIYHPMPESEIRNNAPDIQYFCKV